MGKMAETSLANRRRSSRRKPRRSVIVECRKGSHELGANLAKELLDTSDSGIRLVVAQALDLQSEVTIVISGYGMKEPIKCLGIVRWRLKLESGLFCIGVHFRKQINYRDWQNLASPN
jgi:hypothetical protein